MDGRCDNCTREDDDLVAVNRVYVTPETWEGAGSTTRLDQIEHWCFSCRSMYPHEVVGTGEGR
ncbi:MAG TPA: hypothetical protein VE152_08385 [Acidimicrobiales bacterium]|nr:hypothetical protein [Acidimicrobiales bacterium]